MDHAEFYIESKVENVELTLPAGEMLAIPLKRRFDYMVLHLPIEVKEIAESLEAESSLRDLYAFGRDTGSTARSTLIKEIQDEFADRLKRRAASAPGRSQDQARLDFVLAKRIFVATCFDALERLTKEGSKLTQSNLADFVFPKNEKRLRKLQMELRKYGYTWKEFVADFSNGLDPSLSTISEERTVLARILT
jgi:hypothetical protein